MSIPPVGKLFLANFFLKQEGYKINSRAGYAVVSGVAGLFYFWIDRIFFSGFTACAGYSG
jgi:hypothetical protein